MTTVLLTFRRKLAMLPKSLKMRASVGMSIQMFCTRTAVSSAYARTTAEGSSIRIRSISSSAQIAYNSEDSGNPCLTPAVMVKPGICAPLVCTVQRLLSYSALIKFSALCGTPVADSRLNM